MYRHELYTKKLNKAGVKISCSSRRNLKFLSRNTGTSARTRISKCNIQTIGMGPPKDPTETLPDVEYPLRDKTITVTQCGRICVGRRKINFSRVFAGQSVGVRQVDDRIWMVSFMDYDLGYFDDESNCVEAGENPFGAKVLPMSSVQSVTYVSGQDLVVVLGGASPTIGNSLNLTKSLNSRSPIRSTRLRN